MFRWVDVIWGLGAVFVAMLAKNSGDLGPWAFGIIGVVASYVIRKFRLYKL